VCLSVRASVALSIGLTIVLGVVTVGLVLALSVMAVLHGQPSTGQPLQPAALAAFGGTGLLGATLGVYIGHSYIAQCARLVLPRDPGAGAFIRGSAAATVATMLLALVWVVAVADAVPPALLLDQLGTPLTALGAALGPAAQGLGGVLVLLLLGLAFVRQVPIMVELVREWVPATSGTTLDRGRPAAPGRREL
jgi:hypothetical protein